MSLWWLEPGWTAATCACGAAIWPDGDPDWGACLSCFTAQLDEQEHYRQLEAEYAASFPSHPEKTHEP